MTETNYKMVEEFHTVYEVDPRPILETLPLRYSLVSEEVQELNEAKTPVDQLDALTDILYVTYGSVISLKLDTEYALASIPDAEDITDMDQLINLLNALVKDFAMAHDLDLVEDALHNIAFWADKGARDLGFDIDGAFNAVHRSNMSKLDDNGKPVKRIDGKILKGPNFFTPNLGPFVPKTD